MKNKTDFSKGKYTADSVIGRAYRVHDKWVEKKYSSKKIVESVEEAVADVKKKKTRSACINALVCLFALDLRIKERYNNFFRCLFSYFSWRRETRALKLLRDTFKIPTDEGDIRTAIEVALQRLRETINAQDTEEDDDETHGGKRNARAEEKAAESEEKQQDQVSDETAENTADAKENKNASEEKSEELAQKAPDDNNAEELAEKQDVKENAQAEQKSSALDEKQEVKQEKNTEFKNENNGPGESSELSTDKKTQQNIYNNTADPLPPNGAESEQKSEEIPFIDEVIMDNMVKGEEDYVRHNPLDDVRQSGGADAEATGNDLANSAEKDAHLYDEMVLGDRDQVAEQMGNESNPEGVQEQTTTQEPVQMKSQEQTVSDSSMEAVKQDFENFRMPIAVDISNDLENQMRIDITNSLSDEAKIEMIRLQMEAAREQIEIASADLGFDAPVDNTGVQKPPSIDPPVSQQYRK